MKDQFLKKVLDTVGSAKLANELGISKQAVSQWVKVPASRVLEVEKISGIPRYELRPDFYPNPKEERQSAV